MEGALGGKFVLDFQISNLNRLHFAAHTLAAFRWQVGMRASLRFVMEVV